MKFNSTKNIYQQHNTRRFKSITYAFKGQLLYITLATIIIATSMIYTAEALWLFQQGGGSAATSTSSSSSTDSGDQQQALEQQAQEAQQVASQQQDLALKGGEQTTTPATSTFGGYGASLLSIAGIQPSSIASLLNTVGDTGFRYFNIQDQCRNRAACDLGYMLFKKLSFVHNWLIRTSVRTLTDMNNIYTQSWMEGMLGRNCTVVYATCRESPLEGIMNLAMLQHLATGGLSSNTQVTTH